MKLSVFIFVIGVFLFPVNLISQETTNQLDENGNPHGLWKKYYEGSQQLRYEGTFEHGKEVGEFKFYCEDCKDQPVAIKKFNSKDDISEVEYFNKKGNLVSTGKMKGKDRVGEWITYHENSKVPMVKEMYVNGKLDGKRSTFYADGKITEELNFTNGIKNGSNLYYAPNGVVIKKLEYKNGKLHGPVFYYDGHGNLSIEGAYKDDRKHGIWKYYKDGKLVVEETFPKKNLE